MTQCVGPVNGRSIARSDAPVKSYFRGLKLGVSGGFHGACFAALLFVTRADNNSADNPFP